MSSRSRQGSLLSEAASPRVMPDHSDMFSQASPRNVMLPPSMSFSSMPQPIPSGFEAGSPPLHGSYTHGRSQSTNSYLAQQQYPWLKAEPSLIPRESYDSTTSSILGTPSMMNTPTEAAMNSLAHLSTQSPPPTATGFVVGSAPPASFFHSSRPQRNARTAPYEDDNSR